MKAYEFEQSQVVFAGALAAEEINATKGRVGTDSIYLSAKGILCEIEKHFNKANAVDKTRKETFVSEVIPNAPPLTEAEEEKMLGLGNLQQALVDKGKRVSGTLKEGIGEIRE